MSERAWWRASICYAAVFYAFLYLPIVIMALMAFNASPLYAIAVC